MKNTLLSKSVSYVCHSCESRNPESLKEEFHAMVRDEIGFTLVEMAVALVLSSIILIGVMGTFILQSRAYTATRMSTELQSNARTAFDTIAGMLTNAGFGITKSDTAPPGFTFGPALASFHDSAAFCFYMPSASSPSPYYTCNPNGTADTYLTSTMDGTQCNQNGWSSCTPNGTDSLTFAYREPNYLGINLNVNAASLPISIGFQDIYPYIGLQPSDTVFLIDPTFLASALATIGPDGAVPPTAATVTNVPLSSNKGFFNEIDSLQQYAPKFNTVVNTFSGFVQKVDVVHVYIDYTDPNHPVLMMQINGQQPIPLADDIEDFQVQFVMDDNTVANPDIMGSQLQATQSTAQFPSFLNTYYDPTNPITPHQNPMNINAVILTIVARSDNPSQSVATAPQLWIADHNTTQIPYPPTTLGPLANYQRVTYQGIIPLPNLRTQTKLYLNSVL
jgi:type II secretory pathway component PulJ